MSNPSPSELPRVRILLATYNGDRWVDEQLDSLAAQTGVSLSVVASDDQSTDRTPTILEDAARRATLTILPPSPERFGNANRNFLRLIRDVQLDDVEYFALADQDDVWLPGKVRHAIDVLRTTQADAFSSNVTAFWSDGRRKVLRKSQPQRLYDHLFESAGPGCTFVIRRTAFIELQRWVCVRYDELRRLKVHDWLIYSYAREHQWRWIIDDSSFMLYRQHERNEAGANAGWRAALQRLGSVRKGEFKRDVLAIAEATGSRAEALERLRRLAPMDRLHLLMNSGRYRRSRRDAAVLAALFLLMPRQP